MSALITKLLIANRGEIAVRVIRTCRDQGIATVAVYSDVDRTALHVRLADEAYPIGPAPASESYLRIDRLVEVAKRSGADAVHPGYGFLAENADFAAAVEDAGLIFIGPPAGVQRALGDKVSARRLAREAGVGVAEGTPEPLADLAEARRLIEGLGYPVLLKPAGGGGGKGLRVVRASGELADAWRAATGEAQSAFGRPALLVERYLGAARHIEVQLLADAHGTVQALGERDCSVQRRHQKLIEETPGPSVSAALRERLFDAAIRIARAAGYRSAGTAEFLVEPNGSFVFLEVNTRLQVEHPVTEAVTGLDLVALQLAVARGDRIAGLEPRPRGAAIELRITAEDPFAGFIPTAGRVATLREPGGPGIRVDSALFPGAPVPSEYDPLLAKLIAWGPTREIALARARRAVAETVIAGVPTSLPFHAHALAEPDFASGAYDTSYVQRHWPPRAEAELADDAVLAGAAALLASRRPAPRREHASAWSQAARADSLR